MCLYRAEVDAAVCRYSVLSALHSFTFIHSQLHYCSTIWLNTGLNIWKTSSQNLCIVKLWLIFCVFSVDVTLDPDTAQPELILSDDGKQVRCGDIRQKLPDKPERFDACVCVLGKEGFSSGRFYFEVQVKGKTNWDLGVVRESINRKGKITARPSDGCWSVILRNGDEYKACDDPLVSLSLRVKPQRVGVFVDYEEGLVSFYDVESSSHIYSFTAQSFTEKLYPYFSPSLNYGGKNSSPLIITPVNYNKWIYSIIKCKIKIMNFIIKNLETLCAAILYHLFFNF